MDIPVSHVSVNAEADEAQPPAFTPKPWAIDWYCCKADQDDVAYAATQGKQIAVGDVLWRAATSIGPISIEHSHWGGYLLSCSEADALLGSAAPALYEALADLLADVRRQMANPSHHMPFSLPKAEAALALARGEAVRG